MNAINKKGFDILSNITNLHMVFGPDATTEGVVQFMNIPMVQISGITYHKFKNIYEKYGSDGKFYKNKKY